MSGAGLYGRYLADMRVDVEGAVNLFEYEQITGDEAALSGLGNAIYSLKSSIIQLQRAMIAEDDQRIERDAGADGQARSGAD